MFKGGNKPTLRPPLLPVHDCDAEGGGALV